MLNTGCLWDWLARSIRSKSREEIHYFTMIIIIKWLKDNLVRLRRNYFHMQRFLVMSVVGLYVVSLLLVSEVYAWLYPRVVVNACNWYQWFALITYNIYIYMYETHLATKKAVTIAKIYIYIFKNKKKLETKRERENNENDNHSDTATYEQSAAEL